MTRFYRVLLVLLLFTYALLLFWHSISPMNDFWVHAAVGRWICEHRAIPDHTLNLWTADVPWVYHSWLSQVAFYPLACLSPSVTLAIIFVLAIVPLVFWGVVFVRSAGNSSWLAVPLVFAYTALYHRLAPRPDLFTSILLSVVLLLLSRGGPGIYAIPLLFVLWANLHGAVLLGLVMLGVTVLANLWQDGWKSTRGLAVVLGLAVAAVNVNPYGFGYWRCYASLNSSTFATLHEWTPPWRPPYVDWQILLGATIAGGLAVCALALNPRRRLAHLAWLLAAAALFLAARRNVSVFIVVSLAVVALNARAIETDRLWALVSRRPLRFRWLGKGAVVAFVVATIAPFTITPPKAAALPALDDGFARVADEIDVSGARVFNDFENSSYLRWRCPRLPLFVDVLNAYPDSLLLTDYRAMLQADRPARDLFRSYRVNFVILTSHRPQAISLASLADRLDHDPEWSRIYAGGDGIAWVLRADFPELAENHHAGNVSMGMLEAWHGGEE